MVFSSQPYISVNRDECMINGVSTYDPLKLLPFNFVWAKKINWDWLIQVYEFWLVNKITLKSTWNLKLAF